MKTKYASYLMGKAAGTAMLFPSVTLSQENFSLSELFGGDLHIIEQPASGIELKSAFSESDAYGGISAAEISVYEGNCSVQTASTMNVVITGINPGEEVYLGYSTTKVAKGTWGADLHNVQLPPSSLRILAHLKYGITTEIADGAFPLASLGSISIPVDLSSLDINPGSSIYLQALTKKDEGIAGSSLRVSELDEITIVNKNCANNTYGENGNCYGGSASCYGGTGGAY